MELWLGRRLGAGRGFRQELYLKLELVDEARTTVWLWMWIWLKLNPLLGARAGDELELVLGPRPGLWLGVRPGPNPVSYTHLTLPTICSV